MIVITITFNIYFGIMLMYWYCVCPKVFCPKFPKKRPKVLCQKLFFRNFSVRKFSTLRYLFALHRATNQTFMSFTSGGLGEARQETAEDNGHEPTTMVFSFHFNLLIQGKNIQLLQNNCFTMCPVKIQKKNKNKNKN